MRPVVIDTDIGTDIDDTVALVATLTSPVLRLVGLTTVYVDAPYRARIARCLLDLAGRPELDVWPGASAPVRPPQALGGLGVWEWHEGRGVLYEDISPEEREFTEGKRPRARPFGAGGDPSVPARLAHLTEEHDDLALICIGPLTNLAHALLDHPGFERSVGSVTVMGGCFRPGVAEPQFEHNFAADPGATEVVFRSSLPLTVVSFDATETCYLVHERVSPLCGAPTPLSTTVNRLIDVYFDVKGRWRTSMHDPLAVAITESPAIGLVEHTEVSVDPATGNTSLESFTGAVTRPVSLLTSVSPDRCESFIYDRLHSLCGPPST